LQHERGDFQQTIYVKLMEISTRNV
jgi:hypothetical protein